MFWQEADEPFFLLPPSAGADVEDHFCVWKWLRQDLTLLQPLGWASSPGQLN